MALFSPHFELSEFFHGCSTLERSIMPVAYYNNIMQLSIMLEHIRKEFDCPIVITSCYRNSGHNASTPNASRNSQHLTASAVDFYLKFEPYTNLDLSAVVYFIRNYMSFGQCIEYDTFIHLSLPRSGKDNNQYLDKRTYRK